MKPWELFEYLKTITFTKSGDDVDWAVIKDENDKVVRLIFQETCGKEDWKNNFKFPVKLYKNQKSCLKIAHGWGDAYKSCNDEIMKKLIAEQNACGYKVEICGWSYGGAMSIVAAEDFNFRTEQKPDVITFGAPKPIWGKKSLEYLRECCGTVSQYAHVNDLVPLMPPFPGYKHTNKIKVGSGFCIAKLFNPNTYHCLYGDENIYGKDEE